MNTQTQHHFPRTSAAVGAGAVQVLPAQAKPLTKPESRDLIRLEDKIDELVTDITNSFHEIGKHLTEIRERKLYREEFSTWEEYRSARLSRWSSRRILQLRAAAEVMDNLKVPGQDRNNCSVLNSGTGSAAPSGIPPARTRAVLPANESQARELAKLSPARQRDAWDRALAVVGEGKQPTAQQIKLVVKDLTKPKEPATIQVQAHSRVVGEGPALRQLLEARFRAIDAEVEAKAAVSFLKKAGGELNQELYHAEKAVDHLACLVKLIENEGEIKPAAAVGFVLCREPSANASCKVSQRPRYAGPGWGWTPNPSKGKPFATEEAARNRAHSYDQIVSLEIALRRYQLERETR